MNTDVAAVSARARQLFEAQKGAAGLAAARQHFDGALLDWVDALAAEDEGLAVQGPQLPGAAAEAEAAAAGSYSSSSSSAANSSRAARARAVSALWLAWAALEKELKQWKQAVKTYDQVTHAWAPALLALLFYLARAILFLLVLVCCVWLVSEGYRMFPLWVARCVGSECARRRLYKYKSDEGRELFSFS